MNKLLLVAGIALLVGSVYFMTHHHESSSFSVSQTIPEEYIQKFIQYKKTQNKKYSSVTEESFRLAVFYTNIVAAEAHNAEPTSTWTMGETQFTDLTQEEFAEIYLTLKAGDLEISTEVYSDEEFVSNGAVDWRRTAGVATHVKNQGQCGSCWAFSAVGAVEAFYATTKGQSNLDLSEQQVVDCSKGGNLGCQGGFPAKALAWVAKNGLVTQAAYPYSARDGSCKSATGPYKIGGAQAVARNAASHQSAITQRPVSVCVDASNWSSYTGGVLSTCGTSTNHAVLAFGYDAGFWLIKNSWGTNWGEQGFIRIKDGNTCNVLSQSNLAA